MAELDMDLIISRVLERGYSISDNAVETAVAEVGRQLADKLDAETPHVADDRVWRAADLVREWCGVQQEEERNG